VSTVTHESLDTEQQVVHGQLLQAVEKINEASELLTKNRGNDVASRNAIALSLVAIAKVLVVTKAAELNMVNRRIQVSGDVRFKRTCA
jgi:hypothetical protein